jgi:hypothetical protein
MRMELGEDVCFVESHYANMYPKSNVRDGG